MAAGSIISLLTSWSNSIRLEATSTTLKDAWCIAEQGAKKWADDAVVISVNSTDYMDNEKPQNEIDGNIVNDSMFGIVELCINNI